MNFIELKKVLDEAIEEQIKEKSECLVSDDRDRYFIGYDRDYADVGVGEVCVREDEIWNESRLREDAIDYVADEFFENVASCSVGSKSAKLMKFIEKYIREKVNG